MRALLIVLFMLQTVAYAMPRECTIELWPHAYLGQDTERAWRHLRYGLHSLRVIQRHEGLLFAIQRHGWDRASQRRARQLITKPFDAEERRVLCDAVTPLLLETNAATLNADLTFHLLDQLCELNVADVYAITEAVLSSAESTETKRWLRLVAEGRSQVSVLSVDQWRTVLPKAPVETIVTFLRDHGAAVGLDDAYLLAQARRVAREGTSVAFIQTQTGFSLDTLTELLPDLNPLQLIEFNHLRGRLDETTLLMANANVSDARWATRRPTLAQAHATLHRLVLDEDVPFEAFRRIADLAERLWQSAYGYALPPVPYVAPNKPTPDQLERAEAYFGRATVFPQRVLEESANYAAGVGAVLGATGFRDARGFTRAFDLSRHTSLLSAGERSSRDPETVEKVRAIADTYFRQLKNNLPKFFALNPGVAEVRWLLETPRQFAPARLYLDVDPRPKWLRAMNVKPGLFNTENVIAEIHDEALAWAIPRIRSLGEWETLLGARILKDAKYESRRQRDIELYLYEAARVGPGNLSWLNIPLVRRAGMETKILKELRDAEPFHTRSDDTIIPRALTLMFREEESVATPAPIFAAANDIVPPIRDVTPNSGGRARQRRNQRSLLRYLHARSLAGVIIHVPVNRLARLRALAFEDGFYIDEHARDQVSVAVQILRRRTP